MPPRRVLPAALLAALVAAGTLPAQRGGPAAPPKLDPVAPLGAPRGASLDLTLRGINLLNPLGLGASFPARAVVLTDDTLGKDSTKSHVKLTVPADVPLGWHRLRLATAAGLSNSRMFCVDTLPQLVESNDNHTPATAQLLTPPCVVVGRADPETSDYFKITVAAGQRLSFEVQGRRLGSPIDPVIRLSEAGTGRELPGAVSDDAPALQTDAWLTHTFAAAGEYIIEVRDTTHKGNAEAFYRLRIGDFPCALTPLPLAAKRGAKVTVLFAGPSAADAKPVEVQAPADPAVEAIRVVPVGPAGVPGWPVSLLLSDHDELLAPPAPAEPLRLPVPGGVSGRFLRRSQRDEYVFAATKGQALVIAAQTGELPSPTDVLLTLTDAKGGVLAKSNPDVGGRLEFTAPADGDYRVAVEHANYGFGPCEVYRLTVTPVTPGFELALKTDAVAVPQGQVALLPLAVLTRRNFGGPIEVSVVGPAGLSGTVTVPEHVQAPPPAAGQPDPPPAALLPVRAAADLAPGVYEVMVRATATIDGKEVVAFASTRPAVVAALNNLAVPPHDWLRAVGVAVLPRPPFALAARWERPEAVRGLGARLVVTATREAGFDGEIALTAHDLPAQVTAAARTIPQGQAEATLELDVKEAAALGSFALGVTGRARQAERDVAATTLPPPLVIAPPFDLKVEPNPLALTAGAAAKLKVIAQRKGGYAGPVALEFRNLPAQVSAPKAAIAERQDAAEVELTAAATAPPGARGDVSVLGTANLPNQSAASPHFTVRVQSPPPALALKAEPATLTLKAGAKAVLKVRVERTHLAGPVALTVEGLPPKVSAAPATVAADKAEVDLELTAAADAAPGRADVTVKGQTGMTVGTVKVVVVVEK